MNNIKQLINKLNDALNGVEIPRLKFYSENKVKVSKNNFFELIKCKRGYAIVNPFDYTIQSNGEPFYYGIGKDISSASLQVGLLRCLNIIPELVGQLKPVNGVMIPVKIKQGTRVYKELINENSLPEILKIHSISENEKDYKVTISKDYSTNPELQSKYKAVILPVGKTMYDKGFQPGRNVFERLNVSNPKSGKMRIKPKKYKSIY